MFDCRNQVKPFGSARVNLQIYQDDVLYVMTVIGKWNLWLHGMNLTLIPPPNYRIKQRYVEACLNKDTDSCGGHSLADTKTDSDLLVYSNIWRLIKNINGNETHDQVLCDQ